MNPEQDPQPEPTPAPQEFVPHVELTLQPLSTTVVPEIIHPPVETTAPTEPESYSPLQSFPEPPIKPLVAPIANKSTKHTPFVPDPDILPPVVESKKGLAVGIFFALLLLAGGAGGWYYYTNYYVSATAYKAAATSLKELGTGSKFDAVTTFNSATDAEQLNTAYTAFKKKNAELAAVRAFTVDSTIRSKYDAYKKKADTFIVFMDKAAPSIVTVSKAANTASAYSNDASLKASERAQKIIDTYQAVDDITDPTVKRAVDSTLSAYREILTASLIIESPTTTSAKTAARNNANTALDKLAVEMGGVIDEFTKNINDTSPVAALKELNDAVVAKAGKA